MRNEALPPYAETILDTHFEKTESSRTGFLMLTLTPAIGFLLTLASPILNLSLVVTGLVVHSSLLVSAIIAVVAEYADIRWAHETSYELRETTEAELRSRRYSRDSHRTAYWLILRKTEGDDIVLRGYQPGKQNRIIIEGISMAVNATTIPSNGETHQATTYTYETASLSAWDSDAI